MKIRYVAKEQDHGCVPACIAMVLGWKYYDVAERFQVDFSKSGVNLDHGRDFICERGFTAIDKTAYGFMDVEANNKRMLKPFAEIHIVRFRQFIDSKHGHVVVMDSKGNLFDPDNRQKFDALKSFYSVERVLGFWRELKRKSKK